MTAKTGFVVRANLIPKCYSDIPLVLFTSLIIPILYWFQLFVVFSSIFPSPSIIYNIIFTVGLFQIHNLMGNFLAIVICDTSIKGRIMPDENQVGVKYCAVCDSVTPPRSFHCPSCDVCILKRDHHCVFTSCCIGHFNHRYFINFIFHICISILFCMPFNIYFLWDTFSFREFSFVASLIFPVVLLIIDLGPGNINIEQIYIILFCIETVGLVFCLSWFILHLKLIFQGTIIHEMKRCVNLYDLGRMRNIEMVFGRRWYLTWLSPFITSELPSDGITYPMRKDINKSNKHHKEKAS